MRIQHNIRALNTYNKMNYNNKSLRKKYEQLSSGYRINRAGDDASGLSISEKMRARISGLMQGSDNVEEGISLLQTGDGALNEIHSILNRMVELTEQSMNGTLSHIERGHLQQEIDQLSDEITRISEATRFNDIQILRGIEPVEVPIYGTKGYLPNWVKATSTPLGSLSQDLIVNQTTKEIHSAAYLDFNGMNVSNASDLLNNGFYNTCCTCNARYSIRFVNTGDSFKSEGSHYIFDIDIKGITNGNDLIDKIISSLSISGSSTMEDEFGHNLPTANPTNHYTEFAAELDAAGNRTGRLIIFDNRPGVKPNIPNDQGLFDEGVYQELSPAVIGGNTVVIQASEQKKDKITIILPDISLKAMEIENLSVLSIESAGQSLQKVKSAIEYISKARGNFGSYQNRLEHTYQNNGNTTENIQSSESLIRDTNIALAMIDLVKSNILIQAGQSMLVQANINSQNILQLLK